MAQTLEEVIAPHSEKPHYKLLFETHVAPQYLPLARLLMTRAFQFLIYSRPGIPDSNQFRLVRR